jgi:hypothetical protein
VLWSGGDGDELVNTISEALSVSGVYFNIFITKAKQKLYILLKFHVTYIFGLYMLV